MLLSILIQGKNDNYGADKNGKGGVSQRLKLTLANLIENIKQLNKPDIEVVFCDWSSENKILGDQIIDKPSFFKYIYVPADIGKKYSKKANYSISHAYNVSLRHSTGEYVIFWDSDCWIRYSDLEKLYNFVKNNSDTKNYNEYYWGSRYHVPRHIWNETNSYTDLIDYFNNINLSSIKHDKIYLNNFDGRAMALLLYRDMAIKSTGWWEELPYWGVQDIEYNHRLAKKYILGGDLEDSGILFFHLDHHDANDVQHTNENLRSLSFAANGENWGLKEENVIIL